MFEKFQSWYEKRHEYARDWKARKKRKVLGYLCTYVPEEVIYAAGALPVRILGSHEPSDVTEPHIYGMYCPFCRDTLAQGLLGRYDYLDGIIGCYTCMHLAHTFDSWSIHLPLSGNFMLYMPNMVQSPRAKPFLKGQLSLFMDSLQRWTGDTISEEDLDRGIEILNTNRRLLRKIYELRKGENPP